MTCIPPRLVQMPPGVQRDHPSPRLYDGGPLVKPEAGTRLWKRYIVFTIVDLFFSLSRLSFSDNLSHIEARMHANCHPPAPPAPTTHSGKQAHVPGKVSVTSGVRRYTSRHEYCVISVTLQTTRNVKTSSNMPLSFKKIVREIG